MTDRHDDDDILEAFFQTARANAPGLPAPLAARIAADAERLRPAQRTGPAAWLAAVTAALGGWRPLAGLAAAGIAGLWVGIAPPAPLADLAGRVLDDAVELDLSDLYALADDAWIEG